METKTEYVALTKKLGFATDPHRVDVSLYDIDGYELTPSRVVRKEEATLFTFSLPLYDVALLSLGITYHNIKTAEALRLFWTGAILVTASDDVYTTFGKASLSEHHVGTTRILEYRWDNILWATIEAKMNTKTFTVSINTVALEQIYLLVSAEYEANKGGNTDG